MLSKVYGQESVKEKLTSFLGSKVPTVLLFIGPSGVGKLTTALNFIDEIYNGKYCLKNHPDIKVFIPEKKVFKLEAVSQVVAQSSLSPLELSHNYFILKDIHLMNSEAANALLKVLEEQQDYNRFILIAEDIQRILPTIISRSVSIEFGTVSLKTYFPDIADFEEKLASGSVGKYLAVKNLFLEPKYQALVSFLKKYPQLSFAEILEWYADFEKFEHSLMSDLILLAANELLLQMQGDISYLESFVKNISIFQEKLKYSLNEEMHFKNALIQPKSELLNF